MVVLAMVDLSGFDIMIVLFMYTPVPILERLSHRAVQNLTEG